jgi:hypothetical protein
MRVIACLLLSLTVVSAQSYPPPYPRAGTTALVDNARVQVWDVSWPKGVPAVMHRHLYDMTGVYYWPGDRLITATDGTKRNVSTAAGRIQWQLKGITHIEEGTSDDPLRAVMIELKGDGPSGKRSTEVGAPAFSAATMPLLDNERVTVWDFPGTTTPVRHFHPMDTVVVWTEGRSGKAMFLAAGTVHTAELISAAAKATIFELK